MQPGPDRDGDPGSRRLLRPFEQVRGNFDRDLPRWIHVPTLPYEAPVSILVLTLIPLSGTAEPTPPNARHRRPRSLVAVEPVDVRGLRVAVRRDRGYERL